MYITYPEYTNLYGPVEGFDRLAFEACRCLDRHTTGVDGVKKLKMAFPVEEDAIAAVKHCAASIVSILHQIREAEQSASMARGYTETENGLQGRVIASVSAGNESISFAAAGQKTAADMAVADVAARNRLIHATVREYLSGVTDANGVNLLYMGVYPHV